jgi:hypothetical protein
MMDDALDDLVKYAIKNGSVDKDGKGIPETVRIKIREIMCDKVCKLCNSYIGCSLYGFARMRITKNPFWSGHHSVACRSRNVFITLDDNMAISSVHSHQNKGGK